MYVNTKIIVKVPISLVSYVVGFAISAIWFVFMRFFCFTFCNFFVVVLLIFFFIFKFALFCFFFANLSLLSFSFWNFLLFIFRFFYDTLFSESSESSATMLKTLIYYIQSYSHTSMCTIYHLFKYLAVDSLFIFFFIELICVLQLYFAYWVIHVYCSTYCGVTLYSTNE